MVTARAVILELWKEARMPNTTKDGCAMSSSSTRLAALKMLAKIAGLDEPKKVEAPEQVMIGNIMIVPMTANPEDWDAIAQKSQEAMLAKNAIDV